MRANRERGEHGTENASSCSRPNGDPICTPDDPSGSEIEIHPLKVRFPEGKDRQALAEQLAYIYSPALKNRRTIQIRAGGQTIDLAQYRWRLPKLRKFVDVEIAVGHKRARLYGGIVAEGEQNTKRGITYMHGYRVVKAASRAGCGTHDTQRINSAEVSTAIARHLAAIGVGFDGLGMAAE